MKLETNFFWDKASCSLVENCRRFGKGCCFPMYRRIWNAACLESHGRAWWLGKLGMLWGEVMGSLWKLINGEFNDFCSSVNIIRLSKQKSVALAWHVLHMDSMRSAYKSLAGGSKCKLSVCEIGVSNVWISYTRCELLGYLSDCKLLPKAPALLCLLCRCCVCMWHEVKPAALPTGCDRTGDAGFNRFMEHSCFVKPL